MLRSPTAAVEDSNDSVFRGPNSQAEQALVKTTNGGVIGLDDVQLQVSDNPKAGATFRAVKKQRLQLEKGLQLMFVVPRQHSPESNPLLSWRISPDGNRSDTVSIQRDRG